MAESAGREAELMHCRGCVTAADDRECAALRLRPGNRGRLLFAWKSPPVHAARDRRGSLVSCLTGNAKETLTEALNEVSGLEPEVPVRPLVTEGHAAEVLLRAAGGADLLVVGSRGYGGFTSALLGSVSMYCVLHGHCPVLVLRDGREGGPHAA